MNRIHICLVSGQPIPNLIPIRMEELRPEKVVLLVSPDMKAQAERLESVINDWGIKTEKEPIAPFDLNEAREACMTILAKYEKEDVILNATGGTKIMAFAAFEVFREMGRPIIYVDTQDKRIDVLSPEMQKMEFRSVMKVKQYLASYGQYIIAEKPSSEFTGDHRAVTDEIIGNIGNYEKGIAVLNKIASRYLHIRTFPFDAYITHDDLDEEQFRSVVSLFSAQKILKFNKDNTITFSTLQNVEFASGGWLEEYAYRIASSLNPVDIKMGVKIRWDLKKTEIPDNEYDVIFTFSNRLYLIECKTKRFQGWDVDHAGEESIYKLDSLRDAAGGLYGKGMLVSYRGLSDAQKRRLEANRLEYCDGPNLKSLRERIKRWIQ